jgi:hypothetical protein
VNPDAGHDDPIVGAEDPAADARGRLQPAAEELASDRDSRRRRSEAGGEIPPGDSVLCFAIAGHRDLLF